MQVAVAAGLIPNIILTHRNIPPNIIVTIGQLVHLSQIMQRLLFQQDVSTYSTLTHSLIVVAFAVLL